MAIPKVVFDCMVFVQAAARRAGPSRVCFDSAVKREIQLFVSSATVAELSDVLGRPELRSKFSELTDERANRFLSEILACSTFIDPVPQVYSHPLDSKDSPYVDLAVAAAAELIVSRDQRHMLKLMDATTPAGADFAARFPQIRIITPEQLLADLRAAMK